MSVPVNGFLGPGHVSVLPGVKSLRILPKKIILDQGWSKWI